MAIKRIGLLGGSFDPVHRSHIDLAKAAIVSLQLDEVQWLPAAQPWQKEDLHTAAKHRVAMLQLALANYSNMHINTIEIDRGGPTYTYDTVSQLPLNAHYFWLLGSDQLQNFCSWHRWQDILSYVDLAVAQRPASSLNPPLELASYLQKHQKPLYSISFAPSEISATLIRERLQQHQPVTSYVPDSVLRYIEQHHLYQP